MSGFAQRFSTTGRSEGARFFSTWHTVTYLTSAVSFIALFLTGELHPAVSIAFAAAWIVGFVYRRPLPYWRPWMTSAMTLFVIVLFVANVKGQFFQSLLALLLYLVMAKSLMLTSPRDYLQTQILCFFILLATAVITVSFYLFFCLLVYLGFATLGFVLYSMTRPEDRVYRRGGEAVAEYAERLPAGLARLTARFTAMLLLLSVGFFIAIPHVAVKRVDAPFSSRRVDQDAMVGFSETVEFGEFKTLRPDTRTVIRIEPSWHEGLEPFLPDSLYLRGAPLEQYDPAGWRRTDKRGPMQLLPMPNFSPRLNTIQRGRNILFRVHQNPDITKCIFTIPSTREVNFGQERQIRLDEANYSLQFSQLGSSAENTYTNPISYTLNCNYMGDAGPLLPSLIAVQKRNKPAYDEWLQTHPQRPQNLRELPKLEDSGLADEPENAEAALNIQDAGTSDTLLELETEEDAELYRRRMATLIGKPSEVDWLTQGTPPILDKLDRDINVQLPRKNDLIERIADLSREVAPGPSPAETVVQLLSYFRLNFSYTLEPETPSGMHPIDAFVFETKKGHCEYFATAFILMLRTRGIPARLINGFYTTEWNQLGQIYIAKQTDAHAWAEVWLEGPGWLTIDPTPPDFAGRGAYGLSEPTVTEIISEYLRIQWQRYVIDYSSHRQIKLFQSLRELPGIHLLFDYRDRYYEARLESELDKESRGTGERTKSERRRDLLYVLDGLLIVIMIIGARWGIRAWRRRDIRVHGFTGVDYIDALLRRARKHGLRRQPSATLDEFARSLATLGWWTEEVRWVIGLYERHRYGGDLPDAAEIRRAEGIIRALPKPERTRMRTTAQTVG